MKLSDSYKRRKGVFWRVNCGISLEIHPPHTQLAYPLLFAHVVILECFVLSCACLSNNSKWRLPSCWSLLLLLRYFLLNITPCIAAQIGGRIFGRKSPFATTSFKKGGGCIFESGLIFGLTFGRLRCAHSSKQLPVHLSRLRRTLQSNTNYYSSMSHSCTKPHPHCFYGD